ncbi:hypothetical protein HK101_002184 [Irineochytrium annulatum]|nr:hypothetical protein HK101_002184 [Irineochytrium annulatum]
MALADLQQMFNDVMSNRDPDRQLAEARHLIGVLCERGELELLCCTFDFGHLQSEVVGTLRFKAKHADVLPSRRERARHLGGEPLSAIATEPKYHEILYSYYIFRGDYRNASYIMYDYSQRLGDALPHATSREVTHDILVEQERAYLACINALTMLKPTDRWILYKSESKIWIATWIADKTRRKRRKTDVIEWGESYGVSAAFGSDSKSECAVLDMTDIQRSYALCVATLNSGGHGGTVSRTDALHLALTRGEFDHAIDVALMFELELDPIFACLAGRCVSLEADAREGGGRAGVVPVDERPAGWEGGPAEKAWRLLRLYLEMHDGASTGYQYARVAVEKCLEVNKNLALPLWLVRPLKSSNPEGLLSSFIRFELIEVAAKFATDLIVERTTTNIAKAGKRWMPYAMIDHIVSSLEGLVKNEARSDRLVELCTLRDDLLSALQVYVNKVAGETRGINARVEPDAPLHITEKDRTMASK